MGDDVTPFDKALWFIESHFAEDIALDTVARSAGVTRYHLVRAFAAVAGVTVMRYVRGRRLAEAARKLAAGAADILAVALEAGYGSHEAFTRAFHSELGTTPESVRAHGLQNVRLMEPMKMKESSFDESLAAPRILTAGPMTIAGITARYNDTTSANIPSQWAKFQPFIGHIAKQSGPYAFGVIAANGEDGVMDYTTGVEVSAKEDLPAGLEVLDIPGRTYAVFTSTGHVSNIRQVWMTIYRRWLPKLGLTRAKSPDFEKYGPGFNPETGNGGFEIWVPIDA